MRFLAADAELAAADVAIQGVPYDAGVSYRTGAAGGPHAIRSASDSIETFSPRRQRDLHDLRLCDVGDVALGGLTGRHMVSLVAAATERLARSARLVVTLGGDHSVSIGTSAGVRSVHPGMAHIVFDAHLDLRPSYLGDVFSHACGTYHMAQAGPTAVFGVRSGTRSEFAEAERSLIAWGGEPAIPRSVSREIADRPVFVSIDLDVLDPAVLPGTGSPEPAGVSFEGLRDAVTSLEGMRVVGLDLMELSPPLDPSGRSAIVAAHLAREGILSMLSG